MCTVYSAEVKDYLEERISSYSQRQRTLEEAEGVEPLLVLHAREPRDYDQLISVLNTNASLCYAGCGCPSGSVSPEFQEPKVVPMDTEEHAETEGDESEGVSSKDTRQP